MYCLYCSTCCQSSRTASVLSTASAWYTGISAICVILILQPRYFSSAAFAMYVLAVEPAQACSLSVTVPQLAFVLAPAVPPTTITAAATSATTPPRATSPRRPLKRSDIVPPPWGLSLTGGPCSRSTLRYAVECDAERENRERCHDPLPECVALQALRDLVTECARADEPADHDDGEHHDDRLVDAEHDRVAGQRDLDLEQHLHPRRAEGRRRFDGVVRHVLDASLHEPDHHRRCIEHRRDDSRDARDRHQVDERDDVDELRQGLQD